MRDRTPSHVRSYSFSNRPAFSGDLVAPGTMIFQSPRDNISEADICGTFPEILQAEWFSPSFRLEALKFQSPELYTPSRMPPLLCLQMQACAEALSCFKPLSHACLLLSQHCQTPASDRQQLSDTGLIHHYLLEAKLPRTL